MRAISMSSSIKAMITLSFLSVFLVALPVLSATLERRGCTANNCLRALRASRRIAQASVDCSIFLGSSVVIVSTATTTVVSITPTDLTTTTVYSIVGSPVKYPQQRDLLLPVARNAPTLTALAPRQLTSTVELPRYATACRGASAYSSACSCIGVEQPTGTITVTDTTTKTYTGPTLTQVVTSTIFACDPDQNYGIIYSGGGANPGPGVFGSDYKLNKLFDVTDGSSCCRRCFETVGCVMFDLVESYCKLNVITAGTSEFSTDTKLCPYGIFIGFTNPGNAFGIGPCNSFGGPAPVT